MHLYTFYYPNRIVTMFTDNGSFDITKETDHIMRTMLRKLCRNGLITCLPTPIETKGHTYYLTDLGMDYLGIN